MELNPTPVTTNTARKRSRNPETWKKNVLKKLRYTPKYMPERTCDHDRPSLQCKSLTMSHLQNIHRNFYAHSCKKDQDAILLKMCRIERTNQGKNQHKYKGKKQTTIRYGVIVNNKRIPICQKYFLHIFGITKHRVAHVLQKFYHAGEVGTEHRGGDHKTAKYSEQKRSVHNYIRKLKCIESHYCRKSKTAERKYLPSELNIAKLYRMYKASEDAHPQVKKSYFRRIFNTSYNLGFGTPQTDVCSTCLELSEKIKIETNSVKKAELIAQKRIHSLRAKAFFEKLREAQDDIKIISFDCQKNLPLPKLPDQSTYYSRQLYYYNFTMVEGSSKDSLSPRNVFAYYCTENELHKDSNLIASAVYHRLNVIDKTGITSIRLVADGCAGQNKNCIVLGACCKWLVDNPAIKSIELVFPVTGHSFMPADRQFGVIEKKLKKIEVMTHPDEITDIIKESSSVVKLGTQCVVSDWRKAVRDVVKPTSSWAIPFKNCKRFILRRSKQAGNVLVRGELNYKTDLGKAENICQRGKKVAMITPEVLPNVVPVKKAKLIDVKRLLEKHFGSEWANEQSLHFFKELLETQETLAEGPEIENLCSEPVADELGYLHV